ncbi:MAG: hypothetical protein ABJB69_06470 [Spartobacteria bacterium]
MKKQITVYWLIPAAPYRELFSEIIRILAKEFDAPRFTPHLTLVARHDRHSAKELLRELKTRPIRLRIRGVASSAKFTKTVFVRFTPNKSLERLIGDLAGKGKSPRDPHVSLVYQKMTAGEKRSLARVIKLSIREVVFDSIRAMRVSIPVQKASDIGSWRMVAKKSLRRAKRLQSFR